MQVPGAIGWKPRNKKFLITFLLSLCSLRVETVSSGKLQVMRRNGQGAARGREARCMGYEARCRGYKARCRGHEARCRGYEARYRGFEERYRGSATNREFSN